MWILSCLRTAFKGDEQRMEVSQWLMATFLSVLTKKRINNTRCSKGRGGFFFWHYIMVQQWRHMFLQTTNIMKNILVQICIPRVSTNLYSIEFLTRIRITLEMMLIKVDFLTSIHPLTMTIHTDLYWNRSRKTTSGIYCH